MLTGQPTHAPPPPRPKAAPVWNGPVTCKSSWTGTCEVCGTKLRGSGIVYWQGKRVRHAACHRLASRLQEIHTQKSQPKEEKTMQIDISKLSTEDRAQLRRQLDAAEPPTFNSALRSGLEHAPIELALDRAHALLDRAVDTLWAAGSEDDKATVRRFFRDALKSEYGKAGMAFGAGALLPHAADAAGALLPSESNAPRYLNRAAWLFTERGATIVAREIGSTAIDSIGPLVGTLRMLLADLVNGMRTAEAGIAGLLPAASRPLNFDAVPKPDTVEK